MKYIEANTFTPIYDNLEDRIRLVINYQDISNRVDLMITRSFILDLIPFLEEVVLSNYTDFDVDQEVGSNKNLSKTDSIDLDFYKTVEKLLMKVDASFVKKNAHTLLTLYSKDIVVKALLDKTILINLINSIKSSLPNIKWGISHDF